MLDLNDALSYIIEKYSSKSYTKDFYVKTKIIYIVSESSERLLRTTPFGVMAYGQPGPLPIGESSPY